MKVILLDNIKNVGHIGDLKVVTDGYARNFLFPRRLAKPATASAEKEAETLRQKRAIVIAEEEKRAQEAVERLKDVTLEMVERANENGTLFAQVGKHELMKKIKETVGIEVTDAMIVLPEPIKSVGEHTITLELTDTISAPLKLNVTAEKTA